MLLYDTFAGKSVSTAVKSIEQLLIGFKNNNSDLLTRESDGVWSLNTMADDTILQWNHPFYSEKAQCVFIDGRPFMNKVGDINDKGNYRNLLSLANLEYHYGKDPGAFEFVINNISALFAQWMSSVFAGRTSISGIDEERVKIVSLAWFIMSNIRFEEARVLSHADKESRILRVVTNFLRLPPQAVTDTLDENAVREMLSDMQDGPLTLEHLVTAISGSLVTPIGPLSPQAVVVMASRGSWIGLHDIALSSMAFESPVILTYMVKLYHESSFYRKSRIGAAIAAMKRNAKLDAVLKFEP